MQMRAHTTHLHYMWCPKMLHCSVGKSSSGERSSSTGTRAQLHVSSAHSVYVWFFLQLSLIWQGPSEEHCFPRHAQWFPAFFVQPFLTPRSSCAHVWPEHIGICFQHTLESNFFFKIWGSWDFNSSPSVSKIAAMGMLPNVIWLLHNALWDVEQR